MSEEKKISFGIFTSSAHS